MEILGSIIVALVTGSLSLVGVIITNKSSNEKVFTQFSINQALTEEKLNEMNKKLEKHNNLVDRTYALEKDVAIIKTKLEANE